MSAPHTFELESDATADRLVLSWRRHAMRFPWLIALTVLVAVQSLTAAAVIVAATFGRFDPGAIAFAFGFAALALAPLYATLACWLNWTTIVLDATTIRVDRGPLPWFGAIHVPRSEISFVEDRVAGWTTFGIEHALSLQLRGGSSATLLHYATPQVAAEVSQAIRSWALGAG